MKILFVENYNLEKDNPMSTLYPQRCKKIKENNLFDVYDISQNITFDVRTYSTILFGTRSIYLYKCYKSDEKKELTEKFNKLLNIKNKYFIIQDMHKKTYGNINNLCELLNKNNIHIIFTFYNNNEAKYIRKLTPNCKHYHLPLHIDANIFYNKNIVKTYDILLYGSIHPSHYPFRKRLFDLLLNNKEKYNIMYIDKPENYDPLKCENGLSDLINQSKICIATCSKYDYFVAKYLEIAFCKSVVAGNMATDGVNIFENNYVELNERMSDQDILNKLDEYLDNNIKCEQIVNNVHQKIFCDLNINNYVPKLLDILNTTN